ncbi:DUF1963 domain-containing protein [Alphaproteobacteria bacterium KMM 3653]|uniref:DUF1963 domain-containing protein n=1 Tax=Harenicola maris TaxID=2841044 RepID=A0AAP2CSN8_9RHOB|nr:DUF1963 domain-containing protein [Harenicola maris]
MKKKLLKYLIKQLLKKQKNGKGGTRDYMEAYEEVAGLLRKMGKADPASVLKEEIEKAENRKKTSDTVEDVTNGDIKHDKAWFKEQDQKRSKKKRAKKVRSEMDIERMAAQHKERRRDERRERELREDMEAKARQIKVVKAADLTVRNLMDADFSAIFKDTGSSELNSVLHARDLKGNPYRTVDALCEDHPNFMGRLLSKTNNLTADTLSRIAVILHRCGIHPVPDGFGVEREKDRADLLVELSARMNQTSVPSVKKPIDTALLLELLCDPTGSCVRPLHYDGDPAKIGIAPAWEAKGLQFWPAILLDIASKSGAITSDTSLRPLLEQIAAKWDKEKQLCGQEVRIARLQVAKLLDEVQVIGSWYTEGSFDDPMLAQLMACVPEEPLLWQVLGQAQRGNLLGTAQYSNQSKERAFRNQFFGLLADDATSERIDTILAAVKRLEVFARTRFPTGRRGRIESDYGLEEIFEWARKLSVKPRPFPKGDFRTALGDVDLKLVTAPAIMFKPRAEIEGGPDVIEGETARMGGLPQLPDHIEWPELTDEDAYHFYAQIDFATLPRELRCGGITYDLPAFPKSGSLFVFLPLGGEDHVHYEPMLIFTDDPVGSRPLRSAPENTPLLTGTNAAYLLPEGIGADQMTLRPQALDALPYMSARPAAKWVRENRTLDEEPTELTRSLVEALAKTNLAETANSRSGKWGRPADTAWNSYVQNSTKIAADDPHKRFVQGTKSRPFQMFGHGDDVQGQLAYAKAQEGKILLCQIGNHFGSPLKLIDMAIQSWISPEDLEAGYFDEVEWTQETT